MTILLTLYFLLGALVFGPLLLLWHFESGETTAPTRRIERPARGGATGPVVTASTTGPAPQRAVAP